jgi:hypothetical protein
VAPAVDASAAPELAKTVRLRTSPVAVAGPAAAESGEDLADADGSKSRDLDDAVAEVLLEEESLPDEIESPELDADAELAAFARSGESAPTDPEDNDSENNDSENNDSENNDPTTPPVR